MTSFDPRSLVDKYQVGVAKGSEGLGGQESLLNGDRTQSGFVIYQHHNNNEPETKTKNKQTISQTTRRTNKQNIEHANKKQTNKHRSKQINKQTNNKTSYTNKTNTPSKPVFLHIPRHERRKSFEYQHDTVQFEQHLS